MVKTLTRTAHLSKAVNFRTCNGSEGDFMRIARGRVFWGTTFGVLGGLATAQAADEPAAAGELQEVVVTGTSIRGAAPVGSNLITVGREEIESSGAQTLQQVLRSVPAVTGFGNAAQGG